MCVLRKVGDRHLIVNLKAGKQTHLICSFIFALGESIPMITRNADVIARLHVDLIVALWLMIEHGDDIVSILAAIVVDVVERLEPVVSVGKEALHDLQKRTS